MSIAVFLSELRRLDIHVWLEEDRLRCSAPAGALTDELCEELRQRKQDLVSFLRRVAARAAEQGAIIPLQPNGTRVPVFGVHGAGDVFCYRALAQALGDEQPFYGLQAPGLDGRAQPFTRVQDLAAYFAQQIRTFRPRGPWIIAGKCIGGAVALELARQLIAKGGSVAFLAFFGVPYPTYFRAMSLFRHRIESRVERWRRRARVLAAQPGRERLDYVIRRLRQRRQAPDPVALLHDKVVAATVTAVRAYEPQPFAGRVHHFLPCEAWARRSHVQADRWRWLAASLETYSGPEGCTEDDMLLGPYASVFAEHFKRSCARAGL